MTNIMRTDIIKVKGDWEEIATDCRATVGKPPIGKEPSDTFKRKLLLAEHSPIRDISIKWKWENMPHWVTVHWVRHKWEKFVRTQRTDRTGIDRTKLTQDEPQDFTGEANQQALIDTMRKRLCHQASPETRAYACDLKQTLSEREDTKYLADVLVPNCVYRGGCPEISQCGYYRRLTQLDSAVVSSDLQRRYDAYNKLFKNGEC